jgi:predicted ATPase/DNA-binding CsgD family transcriptional regulator
LLAAAPDLPASLTSFVGRERELDLVRAMLATSRLVTLTGPGGIGKTRLALESAAGLTERFPNGVWLIQLAPIVDPVLVVPTFAAELGIAEEPARPLTNALAATLRARRLLVLLDNCEHVVQACAELVTTLLQACPGVRVLATSREPLNVAGETVWLVPALSVPAPDAPDALESDAVRLFADRARSAMGEFEVGPHSVSHVAQVCRELDGIPLAIELAAARLRVLGVDQIAARLHDRFRLLSSGYRTAPARHRTLRAVLDWSHDLLLDSERVLLRRLSVFAGGFTLEAADAVSAVDDAFETVASLVNKSLVVADVAPGRFHLLETVRQYAAEKLAAAGEEQATRREHLEWCLDIARQAESELRGAGQADWLDRLDVEHENLRAALRWGLDQPELVERTLELGAALWWFWRERGHASEGRQWLERALRAPEPDALATPAAVRARALDALGALAHSQGAYAAARGAVESALAIWRAEDDRRGMIASLNTLGIVAKAEGDHARATALLQEMLAQARAVGDRGRVATALNNLAALALDTEDYHAGRELLIESLALKRELGDRVGIVAALHNLGETAFHLGSFDQATSLLEESVALSTALGATHRCAQSLHSLGMTRLRLGNENAAIAELSRALRLFHDMSDEWGIALCLEGLAQAAAARPGNALAVHLFSAAAAWRTANGSPVPPNDRADYERALDAARSALGEARFAAAWASGSRMTLEQAMQAGLALHGAAPVPRDATSDTLLSPREMEVARLVARGQTNRQIALELGISNTTVDRHVSNILDKNSFASRAQVAAWVARSAADVTLQ